MPTATTVSITAGQFAALCNLFHTTHCDHIDLTPRQIGDVLYYNANNTVCDHSRLVARAVMAYLGLEFADEPEADVLVHQVRNAMLAGEGTMPHLDEVPGARQAWEASRPLTLPESVAGSIAEKFAHPDFVVTEEDAIAEGAVVSMSGWGIATFRGEPVRTVSRAMFDVLRDAFGLAASKGLTMTEKDWEETLAERKADGQSAPPLGDLDGRTGLVPPWAVLGDLLQAIIDDARDTAEPGEPQDNLYATRPVKALGGEPVWLQRPRPGEWTAFFPEDN